MTKHEFSNYMIEVERSSDDSPFVIYNEFTGTVYDLTLQILRVRRHAQDVWNIKSQSYKIPYGRLLFHTENLVYQFFEFLIGLISPEAFQSLNQSFIIPLLFTFILHIEPFPKLISYY